MTYIQNKKIQNYVHNVDTSFTKEVITTTLEYYPGTEVTYTPSSNASSVIYECNLQIAWDPDAKGSYQNTRVQYSSDDGSSWTTIDGTRLFEGSFATSADYDWYYYCWLFVLPIWSGERKIRLSGRSHNTSSEFTIGRSYNAQGSEGVGSCPHVSIYSIM